MERRYPALKARLKELIVETEAAKISERALAIDKVRRLLASVDLRPEDLGRYLAIQGKPPRQRSMPGSRQHVSRSTPKQQSKRPSTNGAKRVAAPRNDDKLFMDPHTGETWSGRGRRPAWLRGNESRYHVTGY